MIFKDINCGFYTSKQPLQYACLYDDVKKVSEKLGITKRAVYNYSKGIDSNKITKKILAESNGTDYPVYRLLPPAYMEESFTRDEMERAITEDKALFRIEPERFNTPLFDWLFRYTFDILSETGTPLLVSLQELNLSDAADILKKYTDLKLIITNTDQWKNRQYVSFAQSFKNVYFDTCNTIEYYGLENMCKIIGADRFLFGTYMPEKEPYDKVFQLMYSDLAEEEKELIAHGNFERLIEKTV